MDKKAKIYVAGHRGLVGSALVRCLQTKGFTNLVTKNRAELDLATQQAVNDFFAAEKPDYVFLAAAKAGGILANKTYKADFIYENIIIETNVIKAAHDHRVKKLLFLASSCIYPKHAHQPIKEEALLTGALEETNDAYAVAKIAGLKMCQSFNEQYSTNFISVMPTNLYGPNDNFDLETSHVVPALFRKFHEAKVNHAPEVVVWGSGTPRREFLHVDDLAYACVFLMEHYDGSEIINIGTGEDITIKDLAELIKKIVGFKGKIVWDTSKPDGMPRKQLDVSRLHSLGWKHTIGFTDGLQMTYDWYQKYGAS